MKKILYITVGVISVVLGIIGIFVPGLPTTPFLLLSSWLFYKSSKSMHDWLHRSYLGRYIRRYEMQEGASILSKVISLVCMWIMISISAFCFFEHPHARIVLMILGCIGSYCVLFVVPTASKKKKRL